MILRKITARTCRVWLSRVVSGSSQERCFSSLVPAQPVPPLAQTLQGYLRALEPLIPEEELVHTRKNIQKFCGEGGLGPQLQEGLERRARHSNNWISDWWVQWAYLESRQPLPVHSNPAISLPKRDFSDWRGQLVFASKLIAAALDFKNVVDNGRLPVEYMRGQPLCMELFPLLFSSCRIPGRKHDTITHHSRARHITVVRNYQFFQMDVYNSDGSRMTESQIHAQLLRIRAESWKTDKEPMGILTSEHRQTWGQAYSRLLKDKLNKESVRAIEKGLFTLCLDSPVMRVSDDKYSSRMAAQILHGGGTHSNSGNRWFDKTLQFVVGEDGSWGLLYEQATAEGPPIATLLDHILQYCQLIKKHTIKKPDPKKTPLIPLQMPKKLYFNIDREIKRDIEHAKQNLDILINDLDIRCFNFQRFGKELPKQHNLSPNAFIQVALKGQSIDRHLLGLKLQAIEEGLSVPRLFMDTAYGLATHWKLRTGQVPANTDSVMCFGPLVPDGYAVCYNPQSDHVHFSVTAFNCCEETQAETLAATLHSTLCQLQELLQPTV
uniref:Choline/carnitine acyltransferase domain-containing protein n=1 Tax=Oncorhynchus tshawytscha TaxID=74940 RepID=A0A8C8IEN1_ONCTS